jgi:tetratricopeptide (TPR) repeat protein
MQGSNLAGGIPRLQQALANYKPRAPEFYFELGRALLTAGNKDEAIHWYQEALRRSKGFRPALRELAAALTTSGQVRLAVEAGETSIALSGLSNGRDRGKPIPFWAANSEPGLKCASATRGAEPPSATPPTSPTWRKHTTTRQPLGSRQLSRSRVPL